MKKGRGPKVMFQHKQSQLVIRRWDCFVGIAGGKARSLDATIGFTLLSSSVAECRDDLLMTLTIANSHHGEYVWWRVESGDVDRVR